MKTNTAATSLGNLTGARPKTHRNNKRSFQDQSHEGGEAHEEGEGTWIFSYADLITILMMFFILMLSISNVSPEKFNALKEALQTEADPNKPKPPPVKSTTSDTNQPKIADIPLEELAAKAASTGGDRNARILAGAKMLLESVDKTLITKQAVMANEFDGLSRELSDLNKAINASDVTFVGDRTRLTINFPTNSVFQDNKLQVSKDANALLNKIYDRLKALDPQPRIEIEAHLNSSLQRQEDLLTLTSQQGVKIFDLFLKAGASSDLMSVAGFGGLKPLVSPLDRFGQVDPTAQSKNSRIVIHLLRQKPGGTP